MHLKRFASFMIFLFLLTIQAQASPITYLIDFTASNAFPPVPPYTVVGSFRVTFDPLLPYPSLQTSGLFVNHLNLPFYPALTSGFEYLPDQHGGELIISGTTTPAVVSAGTPGFLLIALNLQTSSPSFYDSFGWSNTGFPEVVDLDHVTGTITPVPEGNSLLLLATGLLGLVYFVHIAPTAGGPGLNPVISPGAPSSAQSHRA